MINFPEIVRVFGLKKRFKHFIDRCNAEQVPEQSYAPAGQYQRKPPVFGCEKIVDEE